MRGSASDTAAPAARCKNRLRGSFMATLRTKILCGVAGSLRLNARCLDDRPPLLDFGLLVGAKRFRRLPFARRNFKALGFEFLTDVWIAQRIHDRSIELVDDAPRRTVRGKQRRPY